MPRKVAVHKNQLQPLRDTVNAYIVYEDAASVASATAQMNGYIFEEKHLRVDPAGSGARPVDHRRSVFLGNVPFVATEEELRSAFEACGEIEAVRIVRDPATNIGKGFAFIVFTVRVCPPTRVRARCTLG